MSTGKEPGRLFVSTDQQSQHNKQSGGHTHESAHGGNTRHRIGVVAGAGGTARDVGEAWGQSELWQRRELEVLASLLQFTSQSLYPKIEETS